MSHSRWERRQDYTLVGVLLDDRIAPRRFTEPLRAELGDPLLRLEVHVDQPEAIAVPINPFEVVLRTPVKIPIHGRAVGCRTLELCETSAQEHHPVRVVHAAVL